MTIQWFPGHMHKARLEMQSMLPKVNVVIEVLDARIPYSSENPLLAELRGDTPCLKVLTKSDLADESMTQVWQTHFNQTRNVHSHVVTTEDVPSIRQIKRIIKDLAIDRQNRSILAMIVGIPNVGKSTIINYLAGKKVAKTGNTPAVTKQQQRVIIGDSITLLDTPGMMWPNVQNARSGYRLALLGSVKETAMDYADIGFFAAKYMLAQYPDRFSARYDLDELPTTELEAIEAIGRRRGCLGKNNQVDIDRASRILVTELRSGEFGRLTLETPKMMMHERAETDREVAEKLAKAAEKDAKRKKRFRDKQRAKRKSAERD